MPKQPGELYLELHVLYYEDEAVAAAGIEAELLFVRGLCFAKRLLTDGAIGEAQLRTISHGLSDPAAAAARLVGLRLWRRRKGGYTITNFLKRNQSRAEIAARSAEQSRFGDKGNHLRWHQNSPRRDCEWCRQEAVSRSPVGGRSGRPSGTRSGRRVGGESGREDRSTTESEATTESSSGTESGDAPPARVREASPAANGNAKSARPSRGAAGTPYLGIEPGDSRHPVAKLLATRFRWTEASEAEWDGWWEEVDNEFPTGTSRDDAVAGWAWLADELRKVPRDVADPKRWFFDRRREVKDQRLTTAAERERRHEETKHAEGGPIAASLVQRMEAERNGRPKLSRVEAIERWRPFYGTVEADLLERQIEPYGLTLSDLADLDDDGPDFGTPEPAHA